MLSTLRRKVRSGIWHLKHRTEPGIRRLRYRLIIEQMHLAVCTPCQYDCVSCSHQGIRYQHKHYQMPLEDVREFVRCTEASGYFIEKLLISGPGDPLLWTHLREGLRLLRASKSIREIEMLTNGLALDRVDDETWTCFDRLVVSLYPAAEHVEPHLRDAQRKHPGKLSIRKADQFRGLPAPGATAPIPCRCDCTGPMYFDRKMFFFCGPTVFTAAASKGVDALDYPDLYTDIRPGYMAGQPGVDTLGLIAGVDRKVKTGNHELCRYCFANLNFAQPRHEHLAFYRK